MRVLIACEFSGIVRDAFAARGHDAWSCDLLPTERPGQHIQGDVLNLFGCNYDLIIAFPPCTHLSSSGARWFKGKAREQHDAICFVRALSQFSTPMIAIENPIGVLSTQWRKPDQIIQPWMFGHDASKSTCLWLKSLPLLKPTHSVQRPAWIRCPDCDDFFCQRHGMQRADCSCPELDDWSKRGDDPYYKYYGNQTPSGQNKLGPSPERGKIRSITYPGIAEAMAEQWG